MVTLSLTPQSRYSGVLSRGIQARASALTQAVTSAQRESAQVAQARSLELIERRRPDAPPRKGRDEPSISSVLRWRPIRQGQSTAGVGINLSQLNGADGKGHWIIQEIGTGQRATVRVAGRKNPVGRPVSGATYIRTVKPQAGRRIRATLAWGTGPNGDWVRPGGGSNQQLYLRSKLKFPTGGGVLAGRHETAGGRTVRSQPGIIIRREIKPRHFVQQGGEAGFRTYRGSVLAAARRNFRKA